MYATFSGGYSASARARSSFAPTQWFVRKSSSCQPSRKMMCITPSASAASVPGRTGIHQSDFAAVGDLYGSMVMIFAPRLRASCSTLQK